MQRDYYRQVRQQRGVMDNPAERSCRLERHCELQHEEDDSVDRFGQDHKIIATECRNNRKVLDF